MGKRPDHTSLTDYREFLPNDYLDAREPAWEELEIVGAITYENKRVFVSKEFEDVIEKIILKNGKITVGQPEIIAV